MRFCVSIGSPFFGIPMNESTVIPIGLVRKAHGIRGEVSVTYYADSLALLRGGVYLRSGSSSATLSRYRVASHRMHHGSLLLRLEGIDDKNAADALRGLELCIPEDRLPEPDDGEIYLHEILGLDVVAVAQDGTEECWGSIAALDTSAGQELWTIAQEGQGDILFPAAPELVLAFDLDAGVVRISPPPGLRELYRS